MIMARLKAETQPQHQQLEALPLSQALMQPDLSPTTYQALLRRFYGFHAPLEARAEAYLAEWAALGLDFDARRKTPALIADLADYGLNIAALPLCDDLPALETFPQVLGCFYVLEGATLGGQIITRHLVKHLPDAPMRYYRGYGEHTGSMWKAFSAALNGYPADEVTQEIMIESARQTFTLLENWLALEYAAV